MTAQLDQSAAYATLTSLAILKADLDADHRDYLDYILGLVTNVLGDDKENPIIDADVSENIQKSFGLIIPNKGIQLALKRLEKKKVIRKESGRYWLNEIQKNETFLGNRSAAQQKISHVVSELTKSANQEGGHWAEADALRALLGFLNKFGIDCIKSYVFRTALPDFGKPGVDAEFIVGRFIFEAHKNNTSLFEDIILLVKGQMYANALTCPDLEAISKKFDNIYFYFDTPIVLSLLGLQGDEFKSAGTELVKAIKGLKGSAGVFRHTLDECVRVIDYAEKNIGKSSFQGRIARQIAAKGLQKSDLLLQKANIDINIRGCGLSIRETPPYATDFQIDELSFQNILTQEVAHSHENALHDDINSIRSIYALRKGSSPARLEDAAAVLVTSNAAFARAAFKYGKAHAATREVSSAITDFSLANIAWLKSPVTMSNLATQDVIAASYAALEPSAALFRKYVEYIDKLKASGNISADDHAILRFSVLVDDELMDITHGSEEALEEASVYSILETVKNNLTMASQGEIVNLKSANSNLQSNINSTVLRVRSIAEGISMAIVNTILVLAICALVWASLGAASFIPYVSDDGKYKKPLVLAILALIAMSIAGIYNGFNLKSFKTKLESNISILIYRLIARAINLQT